mgnify:CR=1 FL=1
MNEYRLLNPRIQGEFPETIKANTSTRAAAKWWDLMTRHQSGPLDKFAFTIQTAGGSPKCYHYLVKEQNRGDNVKYVIERLANGMKPEYENKLSELYAKAQEGGKKKQKRRHHDSSSSSSSSPRVKHINHYNNISPFPIISWDYAPFVYNIETSFVSIPTWVGPISPAMKVVPLGPLFGPVVANPLIVV